MFWLVLRLPWPPSVNNYKTGRVVRTKAGKLQMQRHNTAKVTEFFESIDKELETLRAFEIAREFGDARVQVEIEAYPPDRRARDLDNIIKVLMDGLQRSKVFNNDSQVDILSIRRKEVVVGGHLIVTISEIKKT